MTGKQHVGTALWAVPLAAAVLAGALTLGVYAWQRFSAPRPVTAPAETYANLPADGAAAAPDTQEYPDNYAQAGVPSPRFRYYEAREKCTYNTHSACRKETLANGESVEIVQFPTSALALTRVDAQGRGYERLGIGPKDNVQYFSQKDRTWFFDDEGNVSQLTAAAPGPDQTDVIQFSPDGKQTDCRCADQTLNCCANPAYDLTGKPHTYCTMFPQDADVCSSYCQLFPSQCDWVQ